MLEQLNAYSSNSLKDDADTFYFWIIAIAIASIIFFFWCVKWMLDVRWLLHRNANALEDMKAIQMQMLDAQRLLRKIASILDDIKAIQIQSLPKDEFDVPRARPQKTEIEDEECKIKVGKNSQYQALPNHVDCPNCGCSVNATPCPNCGHKL